jgi:ankyrin repeat protein
VGGDDPALKDMTKENVIPRLGYFLRALIKAGGYRGHLVGIGLDKDLDDLALEAKDRQGTIAELMQKIEDACSKAMTMDCGYEWAQFFRLAWFRTREAIQALAQHVDTSPMAAEQGRELFFRHFAVPMLSGLLRLCANQRPGPDIEQWWQNAFQSWVSFAASKAKISEQTLLTNLANEIDADQRTIERWLSGEPMGKLVWPYAPKVMAALGEQGQKQMTPAEIHFLAGWLLVASAFQSLPPPYRDAARRDFNLRKQEPWSLEDAITSMNKQGFDLGSSPIRDSAVPLLGHIQNLFAIRPLDDSAIQQKLHIFQRLIEHEQPVSSASYQYIHDWLSARLAALQGKQDEALGLYTKAVAGAWWKAGPNQHPIMNEALLYAVGVADKADAANYWDKTFLLGLNKGPKRLLDEQELRRIAFSFEKMFYPQKAKDRIPPPMEFIVRDTDFEVERKHLANPNQKAKRAEGRTRRTPLMDAIREGTLDDVKRLIDAGGDPNDFIKESGEGPLSYAMRRACDRKDPIIMEFLLELDLLTETVNRPASTKRETPLKIAVEMANAHAVTRLIELGADVERACDCLPSAMCYAMILFHGSLHRDDSTQEMAYLAGKTRADMYDAKEGAVLDIDLAARRQRLHALANASERNRLIREEVWGYFIRPADDHRKVIQALLAGGADANRRYRVEPHHLAEWTPTLFAAQVGDLGMFRMLVEHSDPNRGDPDLTLMPPSSLERFDALWVAIDHGRHVIVSYLMEREKHQYFRLAPSANF